MAAEQHALNVLCAPVARGVSVMSKLRFNQIRQALADAYGNTDTTRAVVGRIQEIMKFCPDTSTYTPAQAQRIKAWRRKKQEETGLSLYVITGKQRRDTRKKAERASADKN
jgi:hypothetical protein